MVDLVSYCSGCGGTYTADEIGKHRLCGSAKPAKNPAKSAGPGLRGGARRDSTGEGRVANHPVIPESCAGCAERDREIEGLRADVARLTAENAGLREQARVHSIRLVNTNSSRVNKSVNTESSQAVHASSQIEARKAYRREWMRRRRATTQRV